MTSRGLLKSLVLQWVRRLAIAKRGRDAFIEDYAAVAVEVIEAMRWKTAVSKDAMDLAVAIKKAGKDAEERRNTGSNTSGDRQGSADKS